MIPGSGRSSGGGIDYPLQYSWASLVAQLVKNPPIMRETWTRPWVGNIFWRRERLPIPVFWPGQVHGLYSPWGRKESDTTEGLSLCIMKFDFQASDIGNNTCDAGQGNNPRLPVSHVIMRINNQYIYNHSISLSV